MSNTIFIDSLTKCRFESIFGDGTYWGCLTIAKLITAISMSVLVCLIFFIIIVRMVNAK